MPNIVNLNGSRFIKPPGDIREQNVEQMKKAREEYENIVEDGLLRLALANDVALRLALADGKISDAELEKLAEINFTVDDVRNILNNSKGDIENFNLSDDDMQKLTDDLMTRIETYRQLNQEREGQEPTQFGL